MKSACAGIVLAPLLWFGGQSAQRVELTRSGTHVDVQIGGRPFATYYFDPSVAKPYFFPLRSALGTVVTRAYPMTSAIAGEDLGRDAFTHLGPIYEPLLSGAALLAVYWLILYWMYRRGLYLRI